MTLNSISGWKKLQYCQEKNKFSALPLNVHSIREADSIEQMIGGVRYENIPIPNSMKSTTLFVGNLCEFTNDDDLSQLFRKVSKLQSVPACVARKADTTSLQYGFVSFPTVEEKEVRMCTPIRFYRSSS